jgi:hypothetical protein
MLILNVQHPQKNPKQLYCLGFFVDAKRSFIRCLALEASPAITRNTNTPVAFGAD